MRVRIVKLPPAHDAAALEVDVRSLRPDRVYDLHASAASYLVVMGFADVEMRLARQTGVPNRRAEPPSRPGARS